MSDRPADREDDEALQESVLAWLDEIAETEGMSREEAAESLVSSYWQLEEVVELLDQQEVPGPTRSEATDSDEEATGVDDSGPRLGADPGETRQVLETVMEIAERLDQLESAIEQEDPSPEEAETPRLEEVESRLEAVETATADLKQELVGLRDQSVTTDQLESELKSRRSDHESLEQQQEELRDRVVKEFDHIRTILNHLVRSEPKIDPRTIDELQTRLDAHLADRERLAAIARTANRLGVRLADCEHCGRTLDLALLDEPRCPNCEHAFEDVQVPSGLFSYFRSPVLVVANDSADEPQY